MEYLGSYPLKVTQIVIEQSPGFLFPNHLCFLGPNNEHLLECGQSSPGSILLQTSRMQGSQSVPAPLVQL